VLKTYEIRIKGQLGRDWADWFDGFCLSQDGDVTVLTGPIVDQSALHGVIARIRDLNLCLISLNPKEGRE
jgi:hypothetical protein